MFGKIYLITNKVNGKQYVGQTTRTVEDRFRDHKFDRKNTHFSNAIKKHGKENFVVTELCSCTNLENLNYMEVYFVKQFATMHPKGYNHRAGGSQLGICSEVTKERISKSKTGKPNLKRRGEFRSLDQRLKISKSLGGCEIIATNLDTGEIKIYPTAHSTKEDGHNPSNVVSICKKTTYRTHSKRWKFEYKNQANQSGSVECKNSSHAQRLGIEPSEKEE